MKGSSANNKVVIGILTALLLGIPIIGLTTSIAAIVLWAKLIISSELIILLVFASAKILCQQEMDITYVDDEAINRTAIRGDNVIISATLLGAGMFVISFCSLFIYHNYDNHPTILSPLLNSVIISVSAFLTAASAIIAITQKYTNVRHTTALFLASVLCFNLFISSVSGLWFTGPIFLIIETATFLYSYKRTSKEEEKKINELMTGEKIIYHN